MLGDRSSPANLHYLRATDGSDHADGAALPRSVHGPYARSDKRGCFPGPSRSDPEVVQAQGNGDEQRLRTTRDHKFLVEGQPVATEGGTVLPDLFMLQEEPDFQGW